MTDFNKRRNKSTSTLALAAILLFSSAAHSNTLGKLVDDFNHDKENTLGLTRTFITDKTAGGNTTANVEIVDGVMHLAGDIIPPRGQPGWASTVLLLDPKGMPKDLSQYTGVRLRLKIDKGSISVSANSTEVTNFDYHAMPVTTPTDGEFHEVKLPFKMMNRAWSEQTSLNPKTVNSLSIVAFAMQKAAYDVEIDEVSFY
ncbi:CIA30 family protein [Thalassotalea sediminis]|uniref:CIA30 family protein n=1 Tax=Thalassotalea sediminis TaxID=1759089 RepID=UPI0025723091|nr:CIA30 family protein [Thalassotalea sediminis]